MKDNRYQYQNRAVKAYRWLKWKPLYAAKAAYCIVLNPRIPADYVNWFHGRWSAYAGHIWTCYMSLAAMKMGHYYSTEEVLDRRIEELNR